MEGYISQIIGPVVDVHFPDVEKKRQLPAINEALAIRRENGAELIVEVQQHIGEHTVRTVAMDSTDGLRRHMKVNSLGRAISMPIGDQIKGRLMNVTGQNIDGMRPLNRTGEASIHREPPKFDELATSQEVLYTGYIEKLTSDELVVASSYEGEDGRTYTDKEYFKRIG